MLLSIGPVVFDQVNNVTDYERTTAFDFARKDVVGARKPFEAVGAGDDGFVFTGALFPEHLGGRTSLAVLRAMAAEQTPQLAIWGDGSIEGWVVVTEIRERGSYLGRDGRAGMIETTITCQRCDQPAAGDVFAALVSLLG